MKIFSCPKEYINVSFSNKIAADRSSANLNFANKPLIRPYKYSAQSDGFYRNNNNTVLDLRTARADKRLSDTIDNNSNFVLSCNKNSLNNLVKKIGNNVPVVIGIAGQSACGKGFILDILEQIAAEKNRQFTVIHLDNYFKDVSEQIKAAGSFNKFLENYSFDVPEAVDRDLALSDVKKLKQGEAIYPPIYDFTQSKRNVSTKLLSPSKIILVEGLHALNDFYKDVVDFGIYIDVPEQILDERWLKRIKSRHSSKSESENLKMLYDVKEKAQMYVVPQQKSADMVLNGNIPRNEICKFFSDIMETEN